MCAGLIADGSIVEMPVVRLASIGVGEALVENLDVTIGKLRLLGMDFLGNFELNIDAQVGQMVLVAKDPELKTNGLKREPESDAIRQDREHAKRDIDSQITQLTLAIKTCHSVIQEYRDDIEDLESGTPGRRVSTQQCPQSNPISGFRRFTRQGE